LKKSIDKFEGEVKTILNKTLGFEIENKKIDFKINLVIF